MLVVFGLGEKQSSPMSIRVFVTLRPFTLYESKPSVFFGSACCALHKLDSPDNFRRGGTYRGIGRERVDVHIVKRHVVGAHEEVGPAGRVQLRDAFHTDAGCVVCQEENGSVESVVRVLHLSVCYLVISSKACHTRIS